MNTDNLHLLAHNLVCIDCEVDRQSNFALSGQSNGSLNPGGVQGTAVVSRVLQCVPKRH